MPRKPGVYAWYFREVPPDVPTAGCLTHNNCTLLYIGISPAAPSAVRKAPSAQTIYDRVRFHMTGTAEGSTLRLTLGCLLTSKLNLELRRVGHSGRRMTFADGEQTLSEWLNHNAFVTWIVHPQPWLPEEELIRSLSLPLNLDQNRSHTFHQTLSAMRRRAKANARTLPVRS